MPRTKGSSNRVHLAQKMQGAFLELLAQYGNVSEVCRRLGRSSAIFRTLRGKDPDFAVKWEMALDSFTDSLEKEAHRRAVEGVEEPVYYQGNIVGKVRRYSDTILLALLKGNRPEKYTERHQVKPPEGGFDLNIRWIGDGKDDNGPL